MVANRDIPGGSTLFSETPLLIVPNYSAQDAQSKAVCLGCYVQVDEGSAALSLSVCPKCLLPLCQKCLNCKKGSTKVHAEEVCAAVADAVAVNYYYHCRGHN
jgi:hypothetical protein